MNDLVPVTPSPGLPALPYRSGDRSQFLAQLLADLATRHARGRPAVRPGHAGPQRSDRGPARRVGHGRRRHRLLPGAHRQRRLPADRDPARLAARHRAADRLPPRPGLAASVWLAYSLQPDPTDTAVVLPAGLLAQSVPGTGELPQTFETTAELVARPKPWKPSPCGPPARSPCQTETSPTSRPCPSRA